MMPRIMVGRQTPICFLFCGGTLRASHASVRFLLVALLSMSAAARAEYPDREVDRPIVIAPGLSELSAGGLYARATRGFDETARTRALPAGGVESAATATVSGRYGVFQGLEVFVLAPYVVRLQESGSDRVLSGIGRAALGARYEISPRPLTFASVSGGLVLPSTARRLRTDPDGTLHRDHLAVSGAASFKQVLLDHSAAFGVAEVEFPFANEEDDDADRDPPATLRFSAGSIFQLESRVWVSAGASLTRTNRDRIAGEIVPESDQFRVDLLPALGVHLHRQIDATASAAIPVAGKNVPQSYFAGGAVRVRF